MLDVKLKDHSIYIGDHFSVNFQRTLRIPNDGGIYPLPPGLGRFPILSVEDYQGRLTNSWKEENAFFIPMYQREALWLNFHGTFWRPNAVKVAVGRINAITGKRFHKGLNMTRQNYLVVPDQPWLDGINAGEGYIRQFVAMPLGMGYTVEGQVTGKEEFGGIQLQVFDPVPGRFPEEPPSRLYEEGVVYSIAPPPQEMGLAAGGKMKQDIYPDEYGVESWDKDNYGRVFIHIVNSMVYREITGMEPPLTPITARMYTKHGLPWFDLYDEGKGDLEPTDILGGVKSVSDMDQEKGFSPQQDDTSITILEDQVIKLKKGDGESEK